MKSELENIIRSTLVIQNKQSIGLCMNKLMEHLELKNKLKCNHGYDDVMQDDWGKMVCTKCNKVLSE